MTTHYSFSVDSEKNEDFIKSMNDPDLDEKLKISIKVYKELEALKKAKNNIESIHVNHRTEAENMQLTKLKRDLLELKESFNYAVFRRLYQLYPE